MGFNSGFKGLNYPSMLLWQILLFGSYNTAAGDSIFRHCFQVFPFLVLVIDASACYFHFTMTFISFTILHHAEYDRYVGRHIYSLRPSYFFSSIGCRLQIHTKL